MSDTYECANCGGTFEKGVTDDEALAELNETLPGIPVEECAMFCDDCYNLVLPFIEEMERRRLRSS